MLDTAQKYNDHSVGRNLEYLMPCNIWSYCFGNRLICNTIPYFAFGNYFCCISWDVCFMFGIPYFCYSYVYNKDSNSHPLDLMYINCPEIYRSSIVIRLMANTWLVMPWLTVSPNHPPATTVLTMQHQRILFCTRIEEGIQLPAPAWFLAYRYMMALNCIKTENICYDCTTTT